MWQTFWPVQIKVIKEMTLMSITDYMSLGYRSGDPCIQFSGSIKLCPRKNNTVEDFYLVLRQVDGNVMHIRSAPECVTPIVITPSYRLKKGVDIGPFPVVYEMSYKDFGFNREDSISSIKSFFIGSRLTLKLKTRFRDRCPVSKDITPPTMKEKNNATP